MLVVAVVGLVVHEYKPQGHEPFYKIPCPQSRSAHGCHY